MRWRCRRGMRELDVLLMRYMDERFAGAPPAEQAAFEALLELQDIEIHGLLTGRLGTDDPGLDDVVQRLRP